MKKTLMLSVALLIGAYVASAEGASGTIYNVWKNVNSKIQLCSDYVTSSKYFMPTAIAGAIGSYAYLNYSLFSDYQQFKTLAKEDKEAAAAGMVIFIIKTLFVGRGSYSDDDYEDRNFFSALLQGYQDVVAEKTSILEDAQHIQAFRLMGRMLLGVPVSIIATAVAMKMGFDYSKKLS